MINQNMFRYIDSNLAFPQNNFLFGDYALWAFFAQFNYITV